MPKEGEPSEYLCARSGEPLRPAPLPALLAEYLQECDVACLAHETTAGTVYVVKLATAEIDSLRGPVPIHVRHELWTHPRAPVIRTVIRIHDRPESTLALETFTNIAEADQRADFERLAAQRETFLLFYDEALDHRLTKRIEPSDPAAIRAICGRAIELHGSIACGDYDFNAAKAHVLSRTHL